MAAEVTNYKCPSCTGPLHFSSNTGKLACDYCGGAFELETIENLYSERDQAAAAATKDPGWDFNTEGWGEEEASHMRAYNCPSCRAEIICDDTTSATSCPYCNNPTIIPGNFTGTLRPDFVIPFKFDKEAAKAALKNHYKGKKFLPSSFSAGNRLEEIKGIYVPFWLFDGKSVGDIIYHGTKSKSHKEGKEEVTITDHYNVVRKGDIVFEKVPVDGSTKMPDAHMDAIEPYDYKDLVPFSTAYLPGYLADKYDLKSSECSERANERIRRSTEEAFASTVKGYEKLSSESSIIDIKPVNVNYVLLPVWLLNTKWNGETFTFAMNGQTGRLIGDLPIDKTKYYAWFAGISLPLMALLGILLF